MPDAEKIAGLRVTQAGRAEESKSCAIVVSGDHFSELGVLNAERSSSILGFRPVQAAIMRHGDLGMSVRIHVTEINGVALARRHRGIAGGTGSVWHGANHPGQTVISRNGNTWSADACCVLASFIRDVGSSVGRYANVSMQAAAGPGSHRKINAVDSGEGVNRNAGTKRDAAIVAARAERRGDILRTVINCVWICMHSGRGRSVWASAYGLVIDAGGLT